MNRSGMAALTLILAAAGLCPADESAKPRVTHVKLDSARGAHVTTRTTMRLVWRHESTWFVFHSMGEEAPSPADRAEPNHVYRTSADGVRWSEPRERPDGAGAYFEAGRGYAYRTAREPVGGDPNVLASRHWISTARMQGETIRWGERVEFLKPPPGQSYGYYVQPRLDSTGRVCMTFRHADSSAGSEPQQPKQTIAWMRTKRPHDLSEWEGPLDVIDVPGEPVDAHQYVPLDDGRGMVIARTSAGHFQEDGPNAGFYARLFDGRQWGRQLNLDTSDGTRGSDRRLSATFDEKAKVLHLVYTDGKKQLVYRTCKPPYGPDDWSKPQHPVTGRCFTQCVGLDRSATPARPVVLYGLQKRSDGGRLHAGELYLIRQTGAVWTEPLLVSEPGRDDNWYPNLVEDCSGPIGVVYLRNFYRGSVDRELAPWDIMFATVDPRETSAATRPATTAPATAPLRAARM